MSKQKEDRIRRCAEQARFAYEHALVDARHARDSAIAAAWQRYNETSSALWAEYRKAADPLETLISEALSK